MHIALQCMVIGLHAGAMQVIANLLGDTADLLQHDRFGLFDGEIAFTAQRTQRSLQHRQRGFQAVRQIAQRCAVTGVALAFVIQQQVQISHQPF